MVDLDELSIAQRFILGLLSSSDKPLEDHLVLQKEMFLVAEASPSLAQQCAFTPHFKGPFSEEVESSLQDLHDLGLVKFKAPYKADIRLDPAAKEQIKTWWQQAAPEPIVEVARNTAEFVDGLDNSEILLVVYHDRPDMAVKSVVKQDVEARRVPNAVSLYRKGKVGLSRGAELSGLPHLEFKKILQQRGYLRLGFDDIEKSREAAAKFSVKGH